MEKQGLSIWWILLIGVVLWIPFTGGVHLFDWDEINFAECAREMLVSGDYFRVQINFQPFWEKPPFFFWLQAASMQLFGVNEFAARFPNALAGLIVLWLVYYFGKRLDSKLFGQFWALAFIGSVLPHLYFRSGIIDPWFNLFMFLALFFFGLTQDRESSVFSRHRPNVFAFLAGLFSGLAILTKGPVGLLIPGLVIGIQWLVTGLKAPALFFRLVGLFLFGMIMPAAMWFGPETIINGPWFVKTFIAYQIELFSTAGAGHGGFLGYHVVVLLLGVFPISFLAIRGLIGKEKKSRLPYFDQLMLITFWVVLVLFSIVQSKIVHYSSMAYFPMTYFGAKAIAHYAQGMQRMTKYHKSAIAIIGLLIGVVLSLVPFFAKNLNELGPKLTNDPFALANMKAEVSWTGIEAIAGVFLIGLLVWWIARVNQSKIRAFQVLLIGIGVFVWLTLSLFIKKIEGISQYAAIEFIESKADEDCYLLTVGHRSYAHFFYGQVSAHGNPKAYDNEWLRSGAIDKPTYLIAKITAENQVKNLPKATKLYEKNGFVFYVREP